MYHRTCENLVSKQACIHQIFFYLILVLFTNLMHSVFNKIAIVQLNLVLFQDIALFSEEGKKLQELLGLCMEGNSRDLLTSGVVGENVHVYKQNGSTKKVSTDLLYIVINSRFIYVEKISNQCNYKHLYIISHSLYLVIFLVICLYGIQIFSSFRYQNENLYIARIFIKNVISFTETLATFYKFCVVTYSLDRSHWLTKSAR